MSQIKTTYTAQPYQIPYHESSARFKNILGGSRSGKSYPTANEFFKRIVNDIELHRHHTNNLNYWQVSPDYNLNHKMYEMLFHGTPRNPRVIPAIMVRNDRFKSAQKEVILRINGVTIKIEFKSTERPEKLVAVAINGMWMDEAARCKAEAWLGGVRERLSDYVGWGLFSTSPMGKNWYYEEILRRGDPVDELYDEQYENWTFKTRENSYIAPEEIENARRQLPPKYFRREYEASLEEFFGQVYEEWSRALHLYPNDRIPDIDHSKFELIIVGVDWGFRPNPGALIPIGKIGDKYFQFDEIVDTDVFVTSEDKHADTWIKRALEIRDKYKDKEVLFFADPSEPQYIQQFLDAGLECFPAINDVEPGIQLIAELLHPYSGTGLPRLHVHKSCKKTIKEYESYKRDDKGKIVKQNDHCADGTRYCLTTYIVRHLGHDLIRVIER